MGDEEDEGKKKRMNIQKRKEETRERALIKWPIERHHQKETFRSEIFVG